MKTKKSLISFKQMRWQEDDKIISTFRTKNPTFKLNRNPKIILSKLNLSLLTSCTKKSLLQDDSTAIPNHLLSTSFSASNLSTLLSRTTQSTKTYSNEDLSPNIGKRFHKSKIEFNNNLATSNQFLSSTTRDAVQETSEKPEIPNETTTLGNGTEKQISQSILVSSDTRLGQQIVDRSLQSPTKDAVMDQNMYISEEPKEKISKNRTIQVLDDTLHTNPLNTTHDRMRLRTATINQLPLTTRDTKKPTSPIKPQVSIDTPSCNQSIVKQSIPRRSRSRRNRRLPQNSSDTLETKNSIVSEENITVNLENCNNIPKTNESSDEQTCKNIGLTQNRLTRSRSRTNKKLSQNSSIFSSDTLRSSSATHQKSELEQKTRDTGRKMSTTTESSESIDENKCSNGTLKRNQPKKLRNRKNKIIGSDTVMDSNTIQHPISNEPVNENIDLKSSPSKNVRNKKARISSENELAVSLDESITSTFHNTGIDSNINISKEISDGIPTCNEPIDENKCGNNSKPNQSKTTRKRKNKTLCQDQNLSVPCNTFYANCKSPDGARRKLFPKIQFASTAFNEITKPIQRRTYENKCNRSNESRNRKEKISPQKSNQNTKPESLTAIVDKNVQIPSKGFGPETLELSPPSITSDTDKKTSPTPSESFIYNTTSNNIIDEKKLRNSTKSASSPKLIDNNLMSFNIDSTTNPNTYISERTSPTTPPTPDRLIYDHTYSANENSKIYRIVDPFENTETTLGNDMKSLATQHFCEDTSCNVLDTTHKSPNVETPMTRLSPETVDQSIPSTSRDVINSNMYSSEDTSIMNTVTNARSEDGLKIKLKQVKSSAIKPHSKKQLPKNACHYMIVSSTTLDPSDDDSNSKVDTTNMIPNVNCNEEIEGIKQSLTITVDEMLPPTRRIRIKNSNNTRKARPRKVVNVRRNLEFSTMTINNNSSSHKNNNTELNVSIEPVVAQNDSTELTEITKDKEPRFKSPERTCDFKRRKLNKLNNSDRESKTKSGDYKITEDAIKNHLKKPENFQQSKREEEFDAISLETNIDVGTTNETFKLLQNNKKDRIYERDGEDNEDAISLFAESMGLSPEDGALEDVTKHGKSELPQLDMSQKIQERVFDMPDIDHQLKPKKVSNDVENNVPSKQELNKPEENHKFDARENIKRIRNKDDPKWFFWGHCFNTCKYGNCSRTNCPFDHEIEVLIVNNERLKDINFALKVLDYGISLKWKHFVPKCYLYLIPSMSTDQIINYFEKLYHIYWVDEDLMATTITAVKNKGMTLRSIIISLINFVRNHDYLFRKILLKEIDKYITFGQYWDAYKMIFPPDYQPPSHILERIVRECVNTKNNVDDVDINLILKLPEDQIRKINHQVMCEFKDLVTKKLPSTDNISPVKSNSIHESNPREMIFEVSSPEMFRNSEAMEEEEVPIEHVSSPINYPKEQAMDLESVFEGTNPYLIHGTDAIPPTDSKYWKPHLKAFCFQEGLRHEDYDDVIKTLDEEFNEKAIPIIIKNCYGVLKKDIKYSQHHLIKIIKKSVQCNRTETFKQILFQLGMRILFDLADNGNWVLANELLECLNTLESEQNATFILLATEIHIANNNSTSACMMLKQHNIVSKNRTDWYVISDDIRDEDYRTMVVSVLLDALCAEFNDYALPFFQTLLEDQGDIHNPIDLTRYIDKLTASVLSKGNEELVEDVTKMITDYDFSLCKATYQGLISFLAKTNEDMAKKLYQYSTGFNIYGTFKIDKLTCITINPDWTREEVYIIFRVLFDTLLKNVGLCVEKLKTNNIKIILNFDIISPDIKLHSDDTYKNENARIESSQRFVQTVLREDFRPPITLIQPRRYNRVLKLETKSVVDHLKAMPTFY